MLPLNNRTSTSSKRISYARSALALILSGRVLINHFSSIKIEPTASRISIPRTQRIFFKQIVFKLVNQVETYRMIDQQIFSKIYKLITTKSFLMKHLLSIPMTAQINHKNKNGLGHHFFNLHEPIKSLSSLPIHLLFTLSKPNFRY